MSFIGHISGTKNYNIGSMLNFVRHEQTFFMNTNKLIQQSSASIGRVVAKHEGFYYFSQSNYVLDWFSLWSC